MALIVFTMLLMGLKDKKINGQRGKISGWKFENLPWTNIDDKTYEFPIQILYHPKIIKLLFLNKESVILSLIKL